MLQIQAKIVRIDGVSRVERPRYSDIPFCIAAVQALHDSACPDEDFKENSFIKNLKESLIKKQRYILHWVFWEVLKLDINKKSAAKAHAHCHPLQATERQAEQLQLPESYSVVATYANADHGVVSTNPTSVNQYCAWLLRKGDSVRKSDIRESDQEENVPSNETHTERTIMQTNRIEPAEQDHSPKAVRANTYATSQQSHHHDILCFNTSYPVFDQVVTVVETQYSHIFFMETPFKAARFLYKKCIELLDSRQDVPEAKRANARKLLQAKYGKTLREAKEVPADELAKISDRLWHNYLKLRRESKSAEGSTGSAKAMTGVKRKQDADYA
ncbi:hypothetical protein EON65_03560 [archaeon]|nr:MAG: hypothetical protein EON65_03560 [archaeon]